MENKENARKTTESQARNQKKYNQKCKQVKIQYTPTDIQDYERLQNYLEDQYISITKYLKDLINWDLSKKGY